MWGFSDKQALRPHGGPLHDQIAEWIKIVRNISASLDFKITIFLTGNQFCWERWTQVQKWIAKHKMASKIAIPQRSYLASSKPFHIRNIRPPRCKTTLESSDWIEMQIFPLVKNEMWFFRVCKYSFEIADSVKPICLPVGAIQFRNLDQVKALTVSGWGTTENGKKINIHSSTDE